MKPASPWDTCTCCINSVLTKNAGRCSRISAKDVNASSKLLDNRLARPEELCLPYGGGFVVPRSDHQVLERLAAEPAKPAEGCQRRMVTFSAVSSRCICRSIVSTIGSSQGNRSKERLLLLLSQNNISWLLNCTMMVAKKQTTTGGTLKSSQPSPIYG